MSALAELLSHPAIWRGNQLGCVATPGVPTGFPALDAELPGGGWPAAALTEILPQHEGIGELRILGHALASLSARGRWLAWIAPPYLPYAPALQAAGIDLARLADEVTVKRYKRNGSQIQLLPENPDFKTIEVDPRRDALAIEGVAVGIIRSGRTL